MPNHVKLVVDQLSELGKLSDTQRVLRDLENIEKAVLYTRKIVLRRINAPKRFKGVTTQVEHRKPLAPPLSTEEPTIRLEEIAANQAELKERLKAEGIPFDDSMSGVILIGGSKEEVIKVTTEAGLEGVVVNDIGHEAATDATEAANPGFKWEGK